MTLSDLSHDDLRKKIKEITDMLTEIADGNFSYRLERSDRNDELEGLAVVCNMMAEELQARFSRKYTDLEYKNIATMTFTVNHDFIIESCDVGAEKTLLCTAQDIVGKPLEEIITPDSSQALNTLRLRMESSQRHLHTVALFFKTKGPFVVQAECSLSALATGNGFAITVVKTITQPFGETAPEDIQDLLDQYNSESQKDLSFKLILQQDHFREADYNKLREALKMITLKSQWSLDMLADEVGIEKRTLAKLLKQMNGGSLTEYMVKARMKEAKRLLKNPDLPLKEIAHRIGYKNASTFSQIFKKQVGRSPSQFRHQ